MTARDRIVALIPARAGSERVAGKNVRPLGGRPLLAWTIEAARRATTIDRVVVSTDSEEIAAIAREAGAETPFLRPAAISRSDSTEMEFLLHAIDWFAREARTPEYVVLLYPTSPFRRSNTIDRAVHLIQAHPEADSLRSVRLCREHPYKMWTTHGGRLVPFVRSVSQETHTLPYQRLPVVYIQNASVYITTPATLREKGSPTGDVIVPFLMDEIESIDVNTPLDFDQAELMAQRLAAGRHI
jgi:CMP-N,N'-diacetyllegionaminic acid synthase